MPLYVVRWPSFNISLIKARNEAELLNMLDEEADPGGCRYACAGCIARPLQDR